MSGLTALVTAAAWALRGRRSPLVRWGLFVALLASNGLTAVGADGGALRVYGYGTGTGTLIAPDGSVMGGHDGEAHGHDHGEAAHDHGEAAHDHGEAAHDHDHDDEGASH